MLCTLAYCLQNRLIFGLPCIFLIGKHAQTLPLFSAFRRCLLGETLATSPEITCQLRPQAAVNVWVSAPDQPFMNFLCVPALATLHHSGLFVGDVLIDFSAETYPAGASLPRVIVHTHCMTVCFFGVPGVLFDNLLF